MIVKKSALDRCKDIYLYLLKKGATNTKELADMYGMCIKTIQQDMHILSYNGLVTYEKRKWKAIPKKLKK